MSRPGPCCARSLVLLAALAALIAPGYAQVFYTPGAAPGEVVVRGMLVVSVEDYFGPPGSVTQPPKYNYILKLSDQTIKTLVVDAIMQPIGPYCNADLLEYFAGKWVIVTGTLQGTSTIIVDSISPADRHRRMLRH